MTDEPQPFDWNVVPSHAIAFRPILHRYWERMQQRIAADRVLSNPTEDRVRLYSWPSEHGLAALVDLELESMPVSLHKTWHPLFASRPADAGTSAKVLVRGTRLRPTRFFSDPFYETDLDGFEILEGPDAGSEFAFCGGNWSAAASVAEALLADAGEPILTDADAGVRLLADLRAITDSLRAAAQAGAR